MNTFEHVYAIVKKIPKGYVTTYGSIALAMGRPRQAQMVGWALHVNPYPGVVPCHRVVNARGELSPAFAIGGENAQRDLLLAEGVTFTSDGTVDPNCIINIAEN